MKVIVESQVSERIPASILMLLTEAAKVCQVDIWVTIPQEEVNNNEEEDYSWGV